MKSSIRLFILLVIIIGLIAGIVWYAKMADVWDGTTSDQEEYLRNLKPPEPTHIEKAYIGKLEKEGYSDIGLEIPVIGDVCKSCSSYEIEMLCPFNLTEKNQDSIIRVNERTAEELYESVIADSVIEDFGMLIVELKVEYSEISKYHSILVRNYGKKYLEKRCGFKVIKIAQGKFERRKL